MQKRLFIYIAAIITLMSLTACAKPEQPIATPTPTMSVTPAPTPSPTPSPTPKKFAANIVDIPDETTVDAMNMEKLEDTPLFTEMTNTDDVVLVEFWSESMPDGEGLLERLTTLSEDTGVKIVRVNVDQNPKLADGFGIVALPSVYVFLGGVQVDEVMGAAPIEDYAAMVEKYRQQ